MGRISTLILLSLLVAAVGRAAPADLVKAEVPSSKILNQYGVKVTDLATIRQQGTLTNELVQKFLKHSARCASIFPGDANPRRVLIESGLLFKDHEGTDALWVNTKVNPGGEPALQFVNKAKSMPVITYTNVTFSPTLDAVTSIWYEEKTYEAYDKKYEKTQYFKCSLTSDPDNTGSTAAPAAAQQSSLH